MKLGVSKRLSIESLLPKEGNYVELVLIKDIITKVKMSQKEIADVEMKYVGERIMWNPEKDKEVEIKFTDKELEIIKKALENLDKENKLNLDLIDLYKEVCQK